MMLYRKEGKMFSNQKENLGQTHRPSRVSSLPDQNFLYTEDLTLHSGILKSNTFPLEDEGERGRKLLRCKSHKVNSLMGCEHIFFFCAGLGRH